MADLKPQLEPFIQLGANCEACPLRECEGPVPFKPKRAEPPYDFDVTFVAERPASTELGKGEPLAGRSGWLLEKMLREFHIRRPMVHMTNATPCTSWQIIPEADWTDAINQCRERLVNELSSNRRQLVFVLGSKSLQSIAGKDSIKAWRGYPIAPLSVFDSENTVYFPTYHPSHILHDAAYLPLWKLDFQRAFAFMRGKLQPWKWPPIFVDDDESTAYQLEQLCRMVERGPLDLGLDVETAGKEPMLVPLLCIGAAVREFAICLPFRSQYPENLQAWRYLLTHPNVRIVTHNGNHDGISLLSHRVAEITIAFDTLRAMQIRNPHIDKDLGTTATLYNFIPRHKSQYRKGNDDTKGESSWARHAADPEKFRKMRIYCAQDSVATLVSKPGLEKALLQ